MKNSENPVIISEVMAKSLVSCFFDSRCSYATAVLFCCACLRMGMGMGITQWEFHGNGNKT